MYSNELVVKILNYIDDNLYKRITMDEISSIFYFNKDYLMRIFKKELDITIMDYINKRRIYNSLDLLKNSDDLIIKIALNSGYSSLEYYSETFTKILGVSPLTYRKFTRINSQISDDELNIIREKLPEISLLLKRIDIYKNNIKRSEVKKIGLFR
jgi:YesN/AraC family two-component response regulator